jgi:hypothetical protein
MGGLVTLEDAGNYITKLPKAEHARRAYPRCGGDGITTMKIIVQKYSVSIFGCVKRARI